MNDENTILESGSAQEVEQSNVDNAKLSLKTYLSYCLDFIESPTEDNQRKIDDFLSQIQVREYLPLVDKNMVAVDILRRVRGDFDAPGAAVTIQTGKLIHGLCAYAVNLTVDIYPIESTYQVYDLCRIYGLYNAIYTSCKQDYDEFCCFVDTMNNTANTYRLIQTASMLNDTDYQKWIDTLSEFKQNLTKENLQALLSIDIMNSSGSEIAEILSQKALENANRAIADGDIVAKRVATDLNNKFYQFEQSAGGTIDNGEDTSSDTADSKKEETGTEKE